MKLPSLTAPHGFHAQWQPRRAAIRHSSISMDMSLTELASSNVVRGLVAFAVAFRAGAAFAVIDQPRLPPITGEHEHVGVRYTRCGGARVKVFYPAAAPSSESAPYCTDGRETSDGMAGLVGFRQTGLSFLLAHLAEAPSGTWLEAPPARTAKPPPVLVYSHGFGGNMDMASYMFRAFAAHGIVVAAVEHTDGTASYTKREDGAAYPFAPNRLSRREQLQRRADELLAAAQPGALGLPDALSAGPIFLGGHSYGGPAALLAAANAPAAAPRVPVRGLLLHDPALGMGADVWAVRRGARGVPTLSFVSDEYDRFGVKCGDATLHTVGGFHGNFVDAPLWAPNWVMAPLSFVIPASGPCDATAMHQTLARTARLFMRSAASGDGVPTDALLAAGVAREGYRPLLERGGTSADAR